MTFLLRAGIKGLRRLGWWKIVTLMMFWRLLEEMSLKRFERMSWSRLQNVLLRNERFTGHICILFPKSVSDETKANPKCINLNSIISIFVFFETQAVSLFEELKYLKTVRCCEISWIQIWHCTTGEAMKKKF